jgi:DNA-binding helix-hairpin-helix protein with protein kinase domain
VVIFQNSLGQTVKLGKQLGQGGEGTVFAVENNPDLAAKIYKPTLAASRFGKIKAMADGRWHKQVNEVAFPIDLLFNGQGGFVGFTMKQVGGRKAVHEAYNPQSQKVHFPKASFPLLLRIALNIASAVAKVHTTGCVIGDINHSGFLVSPDATVTLIDADSFQVQASGQVYHCHVGVPEFTPPELQGQNLGSILRTPNHDNFGLAILIFYILFMGRHPFAGRPTDGGDVPESGEAIKAYRFAYSARTSETKLQPPKHLPTLKDIPVVLADMFERAFGSRGATSGRPKAADWVSALTAAEADIQKCSAKPNHHHFKNAAACPWCNMEHGFSGFTAFGNNATATAPSSTPVDIGQYLSALQAIRDPGPSPDLQMLMPQTGSPTPSTTVNEAISEKRAREIMAVIGAAGGLAVAYVLSKPFVAVGTSVVAFFVGISVPQGIGKIKATVRTSHSVWRQYVTQWGKVAGNDEFLVSKDRANKLIEALRVLPNEEQRLLKELNDKREDTQRQAFLRVHTIDKHHIPGLGVKRKDRLKSNGISNAADLTSSNRYRIRNIKGCAELIQPLFAWKATIESRFRFNPSQGVSITHIAAVKADIATRKVNLERQIVEATKAVGVASNDILQRRTSVPPEAIAAWNNMQQAEADERFIATALKDIRKQAVTVGFVIAGIGLLAIVTRDARQFQTATSSPTILLPQTAPPAREPMAVPVPQPPRQATPPISLEPGTWSRRDAGAGRTELILTSPNHASVAQMIVTCAASGQIEVRFTLKTGISAPRFVVQIGGGNPVTVPVASAIPGYVSDSIIAQIARPNGPSIGTISEFYVAATPVTSDIGQTLRVPTSAEIAALRSTCGIKLPTPPVVPPMPPPIEIRSVPGDIPQQSVGPPLDIRPPNQPQTPPINSPTSRPPPRVQPTPGGAPSQRTTTPTIGSGSGGLY